MHEQSADSFTINPRLVIVYLVTRMLCNDHDISVYVLKLQKNRQCYFYVSTQMHHKIDFQKMKF